MMSRKTWICIFLSAMALICLLVGCTDEPDVQDTSSAASSAGESDAVSADGSSAADTSSEASVQETSSDSAESSEQTSSEESSEAVSSEASAESSDESEIEDSSEPDESEVESSEEQSLTTESSTYAESSDESEPDESSEDLSVPEDSSETIESSDESSEEISVPEDSSEPDESVPEIGSGTEEDPYLMIPDAETLMVTTVTVKSESSVFYGIQRIGGKDLVIYDPNVYIVYEGKRYEPVEGVLTMRIETALASDFIELEIGNSGKIAKQFVLQFADPKGAQGNPEIIDLSAESYSVSLESGDSDGFYYRYTATENGTIRFSITATKESVLTVTNNRTFAQRTTDTIQPTGEDDGKLIDENGWFYIELDVQAGDELIIIVGAVPNRRGAYPATDITWKAEYNA